jgi:hypothetical protein
VVIPSVRLASSDGDIVTEISFEASTSPSCLLPPLATVVQWPRSTVLPLSEGSTGSLREVDDSNV